MSSEFAAQAAAIRRQPPTTITPEDVPGFVRSGVLSVNEVREQLGLKPIVGGDVHYIVTDVAAIPVSDLALYDDVSGDGNNTAGIVTDD